ncbi:MAG: DUF488 domain-containing protein [Chloroflexi bacterium]|nr:DUF488 domain-containing protein [Chloroflexota bacterium]
MAMHEIFTIGYGGRHRDEFIDLLKRHEIKVLVDVRSKPDRAFMHVFTRPHLSKHLPAEGIAYVFLGDSLGGYPSDEDCFVNGRLSASRCEERDWYQNGIARLKALAREKRVAIMCAERDPENCHRSFVVGATVTKDADFAIQHIDMAGELVPHDALEVESKPRQLDMQVLL